MTVKGDELMTVKGGELMTVTDGELMTVKGGELMTVKGGELMTVKGGELMTVIGGELMTVKGGVTEEIFFLLSFTCNYVVSFRSMLEISCVIFCGTPRVFHVIILHQMVVPKSGLIALAFGPVYNCSSLITEKDHLNS